MGTKRRQWRALVDAVTTSDRKRLTRMKMVGGILTVLVYAAIALAVAYAAAHFYFLGGKR